MSAPSISHVSVENLRGSVNPFTLTFDKKKKLTIIYGENGTGKSTVADAFDLLGNGKIGSLDNRGLGVHTRKYWHSLGKTPAEVKVTFGTSSGDCTVALARNDVVVINETLRPQVTVFRRSQILQLIEAKAADRYAAIRRFVDVTGVEESESALRSLIRTKASEYTIATTRVSENLDEIERFWAQAGKPGASSMAWAEQEVVKDQGALDQRKAGIDRLISLWDALAVHPPRLAAHIASLESARVADQQANQKVASLKDAVAVDYMEVLEILRAAQSHLQNHPEPAVCPLCESAENVAGLSAKVNNRLEAQGAYGQLEAARRQAESTALVVQQAEQRVVDARAAAKEDADAFDVHRMGGDLPPDIVLPDAIPADVADWTMWMATHQAKRSAWAEASAACVDEKRFLGTLRTSMKVLKENRNAAETLEHLVPRLEKVLGIIEGERKKFTDSVLDAISKRVGELYEAIHPGEGLNKIGLALDAAKRASLEIETEFGGIKGTPPQAYLSDSHLDTLGLCILLALAERDSPGEKILVLDDVLGSVDEPHVDRTIEMIYDVTSKFRHCVITTHYGPWRHKFRWGWLKSGECQFVELARWSLAKGISHGKSIPEVERLRGLLEESSVDLGGVCSKAGMILEALLDFLTQHYECSVPRRAGANYTLGDLLPAVNGKLLKALRVEHRQEDASGAVAYVDRMLEPHLVEINRLAQVRNVMGCHFNQLSFELLDSDAIKFGTEVLALADALIDHEVGWPKNGKSGSYWATAGETRRLHPYKKPS